MKDYQKKVIGCKELSNINTKKINDTHIISVAKKVNIDFPKLKRAWANFQETGGRVDMRRHTGRYTGKKFENCNTKKPSFYKSKKVDISEAGKIIKEYMNTKITVVDLCNKYQLSVNQFYSWLKELNTSGTLLGKMVLDPKKYAKLNVLNVIYLKRYPNTTRKDLLRLTKLQRCAYERVANVLNSYLPG